MSFARGLCSWVLLVGFAREFSSVDFHLWVFIGEFSSVGFSFERSMRTEYADEVCGRSNS